MAYEVRVERPEPRTLAAVRSETNPGRLTADIFRGLDMVWPLLREQGVRTGHNVVIYHPGGKTAPFTIYAGVEVFTEFAERGEVERTATPPGEVATTAHYGEYSEMAPAYEALERWCGANGRRPARVNWEVYDDWEDDPAKRRTDIYFLLQPAGAEG